VNRCDVAGPIALASDGLEVAVVGIITIITTGVGDGGVNFSAVTRMRVDTVDRRRKVHDGGPIARFSSLAQDFRTVFNPGILASQISNALDLHVVVVVVVCGGQELSGNVGSVHCHFARIAAP
jgi:hypothetical protein